MHFREDFLHFVWQFRLYNQQELTSTGGERIKVLNCGYPHQDAGPDFANAKLLIVDTTWAGNVEIHLKSSDWLVHKHQNDEAYDNVILHVVYEDDSPVYRHDGSLLPTLILKGRIANVLFSNYEQLLLATHHFPCEPQIMDVDPFVIESFLSRVLVERLAQKSKEVFVKLAAANGNWDETFYHFMARSFGFKVNAVPMQMLAQSLPQQLFAKHKDQSKAIEALIFGQAGFLNQQFADEYPKQLRIEYQFMQKKYGLKPLDISVWKFLRMRPQNFPTLRLAQFAGLILASNHLFSKILAVKEVNDLRELFEYLPVNQFWEKHYHFNKEAEKVSLQLGKSSVDNILINTVSLFLFAYGKYTDQHNYQTRAFYLLESIAAEKNVIVKQYVDAGVSVKNAYQTQALLQLRKRYCNEKKCLHCGIGLKVLKK